MESTDAAMADVVAGISRTLADIAATYSQPAADLALKAVQIEAAGRIAYTAGFAVASAAFAAAAVRDSRAYWRHERNVNSISAKCDDVEYRSTEHKALVREREDAQVSLAAGAIRALCFGGASFVAGFVALLGLPSPSQIAAALGSPEILLATKALKAAGLL